MMCKACHFTIGREKHVGRENVKFIHSDTHPTPCCKLGSKSLQGEEKGPKGGGGEGRGGGLDGGMGGDL